MKPNIEQQYQTSKSELLKRADSTHNHHHQHSRPHAAGLKPVKTYERKRTANLESLIGNLKVRKMNTNADHEDDVSTANSSNKKLNSLYVEVTNSLSDCCSRSTPPLSSSSPASSSISPASSSMSPDSPIQSNASSSFSSLSSSNSNRHHHHHHHHHHHASELKPQLPKFAWMMDSTTDKTEKAETKSEATPATTENRPPEDELDKEERFDEDEEDEANNQFNHSSSPSEQNNEESDTIKDTINVISSLAWKSKPNHGVSVVADEEEEEEEFDEDIDEEDDVKSDVVARAAGAGARGAAKKEPKHVNKNHFNYKITHAGGTGGKNAEDGGRAVKFYDDFIDFRGDILRRPPNSKNCRILWEYLFLLLQDTNYSSVIKWEDQANMVFRIVQAEKLAALWGKIIYIINELD